MPHSTKLFLSYLALFVGIMLAHSITHAQVVCTQLGAFTDCSGPGIDQTQVRLGSNSGAILTDRDTIPYTIFQAPSRSAFDPAPLPTLERNYSTQPAPSQAPSYGNSYGSSSGMGAYGSQYGIILGQ